jgi:hypothetical protein
VRVLFFLWIQVLLAVPQYYCTGANFSYYDSLLNLIGSIHATNFDELEEIAVIDLGLEPEQVEFLRKIQKVVVLPLEKTHPDVTTYFRDHGLVVFGWYAWKPGAIQQALQRFPYVLWLDAGTEVRNPLNHLFSYIRSEHYFICTIGDEVDRSGRWLHPVGWGATTFVKNHFGLNELEKRWILEQESVMGGVIGVSREGASYFLDDLYELSKDLRYYADDGTASQGWGSARHDQVLLSYFAYSRHLTVHKQDGIHGEPILLPSSPLYLTWSKRWVTPATEIFSCRTDKTNHPYHISKIRLRD